MRIRDEGSFGDEPAANLTPLIDVVFLLLIFFMVATTFLDPEREIEIDLPPATTGTTPTERLDEVVVTVLRDGRLQIGGRDVDDEALDDLLRGAARLDRQTPVTIRGDRLVPHERIVRVLDACGLAGLENLSVGTLERGG